MINVTCLTILFLQSRRLISTSEGFGSVKDKIMLFGLMITIALFFQSSFMDSTKPELDHHNVFYMRSSDGEGFSAKLLENNHGVHETDFLLIQQDHLTGDICQPFFSHPYLEKRFYPVNRFNNAEIAENYFNRYVAPPDDQKLEQFATNLSTNQIWMIKTNNNSYLKVWILDIDIDRKGNHPVAKIRFKAMRVG